MKTGLFFTDIHLGAGGTQTGPNCEDRQTLAAVEQYLGDQHFDYMICGGDLLDFDFISSHNKLNLRENRGKSVQKQFDAGNRFFDRWQKLQDTAAWTFIEGNHDFRVERYMDEHPEVEGSLGVREQLDLDARGIEWIPFWQDKSLLKTIGKANFCHGLYVNDLHAKKMVTTYGRNIFYGHTHDRQAYSLTTLGHNNTKMAQSCGCLCAYQQRYLYGRPTRWQQSMMEFQFLPNGFFNAFPIDIFNHSFTAPNGEFYGPRKGKKS